MPARRFVVTGLVQGVFFRAEAKKAADALGIRGWVRNLDDGSVEAFAEGDAAALDRFAEWLRRGPDRARVKTVDAADSTEEGRSSFDILR